MLYEAMVNFNGYRAGMTYELHPLQVAEMGEELDARFLVPVDEEWPDPPETSQPDDSGQDPAGSTDDT